jgi:hypothetical protein
MNSSVWAVWAGQDGKEKINSKMFFSTFHGHKKKCFLKIL